MKLDFYHEEWVSILQNCDFTDEEMEIIDYIRKGWHIVDIAAEMYMSVATINRRKRAIENKIVHYILMH